MIGFMERAKSPNEPKLSDCGVRRGTCMVGGKTAVEAGAVTHGAVRCSVWLGDVGFMDALPCHEGVDREMQKRYREE
jgi:hypothetical protein